MTKWEPRCTGCGCWRKVDAIGYCYHKCERCYDKTTENFDTQKEDNMRVVVQQEHDEL